MSIFHTLDRWIGENVIGWEVVDVHGWGTNSSLMWGRADGFYMGCVLDVRFSDRLDDAEKVIEAMREKGWYCEMHAYPTEIIFGEGCYWAEFTKDDKAIGAQQVALTLPLAICVAAKKAIEAEAT